MDYAAEIAKREARAWPTWLYIALFTAPATTTFALMMFFWNMEISTASLTALAVMNGSINSVIAYLTIQLDTKSSESLQHLENINNEMDRLEATLEEANDKVQGFTSDLDEAKDLFGKVGVDLRDLDLDSVADVVERLKENKGGINSILDNLRDVDVADYINQAKRINWKQLLGAAEEIMGFIQARAERADTPALTISPVLPSRNEEPLDVPEDEELDWTRYSDSQYVAQEEEEPEPPKRTLSLDRGPRKKMPAPTLKRDSAPRRSLPRR